MSKVIVINIDGADRTFMIACWKVFTHDISIYLLQPFCQDTLSPLKEPIG